jgi:hypothetical protein
MQQNVMISSVLGPFTVLADGGIQSNCSNNPPFNQAGAVVEEFTLPTMCGPFFFGHP